MLQLGVAHSKDDWQTAALTGEKQFLNHLLQLQNSQNI